MTRAARRTHIFRVLRELGLAGERPATPESAAEFRRSLEELGTTFIKLGQILSSRVDLLPDVYIEELGRLVDDVPPVPFEEIRPVIERRAGPGRLPRSRSAAARDRVDRADPRGDPAQRARGRRQGAAP